MHVYVFVAYLEFFQKRKQFINAKSKKKAQNMPNILGDEKYEVKLATAMCELTIYDYLQKKFGGTVVGKNYSNNYIKQVKLKNTDMSKIEDKLNISQRIEDKKMKL